MQRVTSCRLTAIDAARKAGRVRATGHGLYRGFPSMMTGLVPQVSQTMSSVSGSGQRWPPLILQTIGSRPCPLGCKRKTATGIASRSRTAPATTMGRISLMALASYPGVHTTRSNSSRRNKTLGFVDSQASVDAIHGARSIG